MTLRQRITEAWNILVGRVTPGQDERAAKVVPVTASRPYGDAGQPMQPTAPMEEPLQFDYAPGVNLVAQPRAGFGLLSFAELRNLADLCQELRLPIEVMKREIRALDWDLIPKRGVTKDPKLLQEARDRLEYPDGYTTFDTWVNMLLEEVLVTDAATLYIQRNRRGEFVDFDTIDGTTIRPLLDGRGKIPKPPLPAYTQVIRGVPVGQWTRDDMLYMPYNLTVRSPYGLPPGELVTFMVNTALRRSTFRLGAFTEGNVPEAIVGLPADWSVDDIETFQEYWDALLAGDLEKLRRIKFMPSTGTSLPVYQFRRDDGNTQMDEWLLRVGCWATGVSPMEFGLTPGGGLGGKGYSEGQADIQYRMGLGPLAQYLKSMIDRFLKLWGYPAQFRWVSLQVREDALRQAQTDQVYINTGVRSRFDVAEEHGWEAPADFTPPGSGLLALTDATGELSKVAQEDDPFLEDKTDLAQRLKEQLIDYWEGLRERVVEVVSDSVAT